MVRALGFLVMLGGAVVLAAPGHGAGIPDAGLSATDVVKVIGAAVFSGGTRPLGRAMVTVYGQGTTAMCTDGTGPLLKRGMTGTDGHFSLDFTAAEAQKLPPRTGICVRAYRVSAGWNTVSKDVADRPLDVGTISVAVPDAIDSTVNFGCVGVHCVEARSLTIVDPVAVEARLKYLEELKAYGAPEALEAYQAERADLLKHMDVVGEVSLRGKFNPAFTASLKNLCKTGCSAEESSRVDQFKTLKAAKPDSVLFVPHGGLDFHD